MHTMKNCQALILTALTVAFAEPGPMAQSAGQNRIAILAREPASTEPPRSVGRPFEPATPCSVSTKAPTIALTLGPKAKPLIVHHYDNRAGPDFAIVEDYLRRILNGRPEGESVEPGVYWAEGRRVEIRLPSSSAAVSGDERSSRTGTLTSRMSLAASGGRGTLEGIAADGSCVDSIESWTAAMQA
jgi:hypothetical protein